MDKLIAGQPVNTKTAYLIKRWVKGDYLYKMGTDATTIESIVREWICNWNPIWAAKSIICIKADLIEMNVEATYIDVWGEEKKETMYLSEMEVCFAKKSETQ